jgi:hypothetical protein
VPQEFLSGILSSPLSLNLAVTRMAPGTATGLETKSFTVSVGQQTVATSLPELINTINAKIKEAAVAVGQVETKGEIPVLDLRGSNVRIGLRPPSGSYRLNSSLALALDTDRSSGLNQLGQFASQPGMVNAVTTATVLSRALSTTLTIGSATRSLTSLQWDGGVRSSNSDANSSLSWTLNPAANATLNLNAAIDAPVVTLTPNGAIPGAVTNLLGNLNLLGRTRSLLISQSGDLNLSSIADTSAAGALQSLRYRSTAGSIKLNGSSSSTEIPTYRSRANLSFEAFGNLTIGQNNEYLQVLAQLLQLQPPQLHAPQPMLTAYP